MIMEALFNGEIYPFEKVVPHNEEYSKAQKAITELMNSCRCSMSENDYAKVTELHDVIYKALEFEVIEQFKYGYALGVLMMKEVTELPYLPK